ncbi:PHP domain-containing protein, partial [Streptomyces sp. GC420]|uniref:PHP domain-containing protein n=1 Tax=Streptomyces sp. GC420 TaxID=2697568 RepID=UPI0014152E10
MSGFTHLHTVSGFSMRYGASRPGRLAERAAERGMDALALTDRDTLSGAVRFARACAEAGVRPLFGVELAVTGPAGSAGHPGPLASPGSPASPGPGATGFMSMASTGGADTSRRPRTPARGGAFVDESAPRVTFLARDGAAGWAELC